MGGTPRRLLLAAALIVALAVHDGQPAAAQTALTYTFSPTSGPIGTVIQGSGSGCAPDADGPDFTVTLLNGPGRAQSYEANADGTFTFAYSIPPARAGEQNDTNRYPTLVTCMSSGAESEGAEFTITGPEYSFSPSSAPPGTQVTLSGLGCFPDEESDPAHEARFTFSSGQAPIAFRPDDDYRFDLTFTVPNVAPGTYTTQIDCLSQARQSPSGQGGVRLQGTEPFTVTGQTTPTSTTSTTRPAGPTTTTAAAAPRTVAELPRTGLAAAPGLALGTATLVLAGVVRRVAARRGR